KTEEQFLGFSDGSASPTRLVVRLKCDGPVAKFFRARFVSQLRSAEPVSAQSWIEIRLSGRPSHNRKLGRAALSCSSHTGQKNFATGPSGARRRALDGRCANPGSPE